MLFALLAASGATLASRTGSRAHGQVAPAGPDSLCVSGLDAPLPPSPDLYCVVLTRAPGVPGSPEGVVTLRSSTDAATLDVDADGHIRYDARLHLSGLPDPSVLDPDYDRWVAWVTTPVLRPEVRLGKVENGWNHLGTISLDKFLVLVTPEPGEREERLGRPVLRGSSPSHRMSPPDMFEFLLGAGSGLSGSGPADSTEPHDGHAPTETGWSHPPMPAGLTMLPALMELDPPDVTPWLPSVDRPEDVPFARPRELVRLHDGDTLHLEAGWVRRRLRGRTHLMYAFNGQHPGPLVQVEETATITVRFTNGIDWPTTVHWHGIRIDNASDGVPGLTQDPVPPGGRFDYTVHFADPGIYWYHPHHREDVLKDLGLAGNLMVRPDRDGYYGPAHREEVLMLDDLLLTNDGALYPFGAERVTHALMGRFGSVMLTNGEPRWTARARPGEVIRFFLTNVANTRTFNLSFGDVPLKAVGSDIGLYEREVRVPSVVLGPAERAIVHARFDRPGRYALVNRVRGIDHLAGRFRTEVDTLGVVTVEGPMADGRATAAFDSLRAHPFVQREIDPYRELFARPPDRALVLTMETQDLPFVVDRLMVFDSAYFNPVEWSGTMPMMNWVATSAEVRWILRDPGHRSGEPGHRLAVPAGAGDQGAAAQRAAGLPRHAAPAAHPRTALPGALGERSAEHQPGLEGHRPHPDGCHRGHPARAHEPRGLDDALPHLRAPGGGHARGVHRPVGCRFKSLRAGISPPGGHGNSPFAHPGKDSGE